MQHTTSLTLRPPLQKLPPAPNTANLPTVSLVIPAYNEEAVIEQCLSAAMEQTVPALEILVIDNRSTDATGTLARRMAQRHPEAGIRVLEQSDLQGLIPTRNLGFAQAQGEILGRIDADTVIRLDWVAGVAHTMSDPSLGAVSGPVTYYDLPFRGPRNLSDDLARRALLRLGSEYPFLFGCNMALRASAWHAIEHDACLDPYDSLHEDIDLSVHLYDAGISVSYESRMRAQVSARRLSSAPKDFRDYTRRFERTYATHNIDRWHLRAPQATLARVYWWARLLRSVAPSSRKVSA